MLTEQEIRKIFAEEINKESEQKGAGDDLPRSFTRAINAAIARIVAEMPRAWTAEELREVATEQADNNGLSKLSINRIRDGKKGGSHYIDCFADFITAIAGKVTKPNAMSLERMREIMADAMERAGVWGELAVRQMKNGERHGCFSSVADILDGLSAIHAAMSEQATEHDDGWRYQIGRSGLVVYRFKDGCSPQWCENTRPDWHEDKVATEECGLGDGTYATITAAEAEKIRQEWIAAKAEVEQPADTLTQARKLVGKIAVIKVKQTCLEVCEDSVRLCYGIRYLASPCSTDPIAYLQAYLDQHTPITKDAALAALQSGDKATVKRFIEQKGGE